MIIVWIIVALTIVALVVFFVFFGGLNMLKTKECPKYKCGDNSTLGFIPNKGDIVQMKFMTKYDGFAIVPTDEPPYPITAQGKVCRISDNMFTIEWEAVWNDKYPEAVWWAYKEEKEWRLKLLGKCGVDPTLDWGLKSTVDVKRLYIPQYAIHS